MASKEWRQIWLRNRIYWFVQDLRAMNSFVIAHLPILPNPATTFTSILADVAWFTVTYLGSGFFWILLLPDFQFLFAFTFRGRWLTLTCISQAYCESFNSFSSSKAHLDFLDFTNSSTLICYPDNLLSCNQTKQGTLTDSLILLKALVEGSQKPPVLNFNRYKQLLPT